jgi:hypothetical protein
MLAYFQSLSPESIGALAVAVVTAVGAITAAVVKAIQAVSAMSGSIKSVVHALGIGDDGGETIKQSVVAMRTELVARLDVHDTRITALEQGCPVAQAAAPEPAPESVVGLQ